jgi:hypothetical protein
MANKKFSQFTASPISSTGFFVGYDSALNDNIKFNVVPISNGGTGADNVGDGLANLTGAALAPANSILATNFGYASLVPAWDIPTIPKQVVVLGQYTTNGTALLDSTDNVITINSYLPIVSNNPFPFPGNFPQLDNNGFVVIPSTMWGYWKATVNVCIRPSGLPATVNVQAGVWNNTNGSRNRLLIDEEVFVVSAGAAVASGTGIIYVNGNSADLAIFINPIGGTVETFGEDGMYCEIILEYLRA